MNGGDGLVQCRNCPRNIHVLPSGIWVDRFGLTVCQKATGPLPADLMLHEPMPVIAPREAS